MGFTGVSFYVDWGLVEGSPGHVSTGGIWNLEKFFDAATQAGIYLIARPGPYINAETTAGGIPGWVLRKNATIRSDDPEYLNTTTNYVATMGRIIEKAQITHGGPVILVQPENEYSTWPGVTDFPTSMNRRYMDYVKRQLLDAGITVPLIVNDNEAEGYWAPGSGLGAVDIYGIDSYPLRYDCESNISIFKCRKCRLLICFKALIQVSGRLTDSHMIGRSFTSVKVQTPPLQLQSSREALEKAGNDVPRLHISTYLLTRHRGGVAEEKCGELVNAEAARVVYKNNYSFGVKLFNIYMVRKPLEISIHKEILRKFQTLMSYHRRTVAQTGAILVTRPGIPHTTTGQPSQKNGAFGVRNIVNRNWKQTF